MLALLIIWICGSAVFVDSAGNFELRVAHHFGKSLIDFNFADIFVRCNELGVVFGGPESFIAVLYGWMMRRCGFGYFFVLVRLHC